MIKAIETQYKGYRFRSRLEARWAIFFDELGIEYQYEPEGFQKRGFSEDGAEAGIIRYLPDFYLPKLGTWVEVKGNMTGPEAVKLAKFLDWGCPLPLFDDSGRGMAWKEARDLGIEEKNCRGMLILGEIPDPSFGLVLHRFIQHSKGLYCRYVRFAPGFSEKSPYSFDSLDRSELELIRYISGQDCRECYIDSTCGDEKECADGFNPGAITVKSAYHFPGIKAAYSAARAARFEHGERPV